MNWRVLWLVVCLGPVLVAYFWLLNGVNWR